MCQHNQVMSTCKDCAGLNPEAASSEAASKRQRLLAEYAEHKRLEALDPYSTGPYVPYHKRRVPAGGEFKGESLTIDVGNGPITMTYDQAGAPLAVVLAEACAAADARAAENAVLAAGGESAPKKKKKKAGGHSAPKKLRLKIDTGAGRVAVCVPADGTVADTCAAAEATGYFKRPIRTLALANGVLEFKPTDMVSFIARLGENLSTTLFRPVYAED